MGRQFTIDFPYTVSLGVSATSQLLCYLVSELKQARLVAEAGDVELVKWLLQELRADVNVECDQLHTPLSVALQVTTIQTSLPYLPIVPDSPKKHDQP